MRKTDVSICVQSRYPPTEDLVTVIVGYMVILDEVFSGCLELEVAHIRSSLPVVRSVHREYPTRSLHHP